MSQKFASTIVDQIDIEIYDQIWILRNCSKGKLRRAVSTRLGLKGVKIAWNVAKVGMHAYLSNMHPNIWSGLNSKNLAKLRLHHAVFLAFGLKMAKIALNIVKVGMHSYFPNADLNLWLNFNFEKLVKRETSLCGFAKVGLKGGEIILECLKSLHARLLIKLASKFMIKFKF